MKKRILLALVAVLVFGLAIAGFAYTRTSHSNHAAKASCVCCKDGACPMMKDKAAGDTEHKACCDSDDCCCKSGDSCPMKKQKETAQTESVDLKNVTVVTGDEDCCQKGADCCKGGGGACCKGKKHS